jgi:hypothetical protein
MPLWCKLADISYTGCYIETPTPLPSGTETTLRLTVNGTMIETPAEVRTTHTTVGMGMAFGDMSDEDSQKLGKLIRRLSGTDDETPSKSAQKFSQWIEAVHRCQDIIESLRMMMETSAVDPDPRMSADVERLMRGMSDLRQTVLCRVANYDTAKLGG